ncbi:ATP-binding protein [Streptosporangium sp. NPDC051023]|uniref:ATP-binding protein n=1 Tax=Streptosporangium sp. NPDC051023 TaxID=3155410 RepID=UPI00344D44B2
MEPKKLGEVFLESAQESVRRARGEVRAFLGVDHPLLEDVVQVVSELVANAVEHADRRRAGDLVGLTLTETAGLVHVEVSDPGSLLSAPYIPEGETPMAESGRGLLIVDRICGGRWGVRERPEGRGRTVWCAVPGGERPPSAEETAQRLESLSRG